MKMLLLTLASVLSSIFWSIISALIARGKNRDWGKWAVAGFFFSILAVIRLAFLQELNEPEEKWFNGA